MIYRSAVVLIAAVLFGSICCGEEDCVPCGQECCKRGEDCIDGACCRWKKMRGSPGGLFDVWAGSGEGVFAVGSGGDCDWERCVEYGLLGHFDGKNWTYERFEIDFKIAKVWGSSGNNVYAIGYAWTEGPSTTFIVRYDGEGWELIWMEPWYTGSDYTLYDVWGPSESDVFFVGYREEAGVEQRQGLVLHYDGRTWTETTVGPETILFGVWGSSDSDIFCVGSRCGGEVKEPCGICHGLFVHYDGENWSTEEIQGACSLHEVWGSSPTEVYAVGYGGVLHYDGNSWHFIRKTEEVFMQQNDVWCSSPTNVFVASYENLQGTIHHYNGDDWTRMDIGDQACVWGIWGVSERDVFAAGLTGVLRLSCR